MSSEKYLLPEYDFAQNINTTLSFKIIPFISLRLREIVQRFGICWAWAWQYFHDTGGVTVYILSSVV